MFLVEKKMNLAIVFNERLFNLDLNTKHHLKLILDLGYNLFVFVRNKEDVEKVKKLGIHCVITYINLFYYKDFCGKKDLLVADPDYIKNLKDKVSHSFELEDNMTMWHIYDYIWNEVR